MQHINHALHSMHQQHPVMYLEPQTAGMQNAETAVLSVTGTTTSCTRQCDAPLAQQFTVIL